MQRAWFGAILCLVALFGLPQGSVSAQDIPTPVGWEMGLVYSDGASEDDPFQLEEGETSIRFWVRNDNLAGDIHVAFDYDSSSDATLVGETHATVGSASNDTFTLKFTKPSNGLFDLWSVPAGTVYDFEIYGELTSVGPVPAGTVPAGIRPSQTIDGEVVVPELHRWRVEYTDIGHPVNAGTEFQVDVKLWNDGNTQDSFSAYDLEDNCPLLTVEDDSLEEAMGSVAQRGTPLSVTLEYDASSTHPSRVCDLEMTIRSTGVANGGMGDSSNKGELDVTVEAKPVGSQQNNNDANTGGDDGPQNQEVVESENFLIMPYLAAPMSLILAAISRRREN